MGADRLNWRIAGCSLLGAPLSACVSVQAIEPVQRPPLAYRGDVTVAVEFVTPHLIGVRCAERGAKFFGLPAFNAGACADQALVTLPDPCLTFTGGAYAGDLCAMLESAAALINESGRTKRRPAISISFSDKVAADGSSAAIANPCQREGWYARLACHELGHVNGWTGTGRREPAPPPASQSPMALALHAQQPSVASSPR